MPPLKNVKKEPYTSISTKSQYDIVALNSWMEVSRSLMGSQNSIINTDYQPRGV